MQILTIVIIIFRAASPGPGSNREPKFCEPGLLYSRMYRSLSSSLGTLHLGIGPLTYFTECLSVWVCVLLRPARFPMPFVSKAAGVMPCPSLGTSSGQQASACSVTGVFTDHLNRMLSTKCLPCECLQRGSVSPWERGTLRRCDTPVHHPTFFCWRLRRWMLPA